MKFVQCPNGAYTTAPEIYYYAVSKGFPATRDGFGRIHPGTVCNAKMRSILKDPTNRRVWRLTEWSVLDVPTSTERGAALVEILVNTGLLSPYYKSQRTFQMYSYNAARALIAAMTGGEEIDEPVEYLVCHVSVIGQCHEFEVRHKRPFVSLFKKDEEIT